MKEKRLIIAIDEELCNGCGECVPDCAEGSLQIIDGKARLVADMLCDGLGACLKSCPTGALTLIEREADPFDENAVEEFLAQQQSGEQGERKGCPSAAPMSLHPVSGPAGLSAPSPTTIEEEQGSALGHWPVQIRLIPSTAEYLENADLVILADCCALAYGNLQKDFIQEKVVMMGCPKFDDQELYTSRFIELFSTRKLASLTVVIMEVPCCKAMVHLVDEALAATTPSFPVEYVTIGRNGTLLRA